MSQHRVDEQRIKSAVKVRVKLSLMSRCLVVRFITSY